MQVGIEHRAGQHSRHGWEVARRAFRTVAIAGLALLAFAPSASASASAATSHHAKPPAPPREHWRMRSGMSLHRGQYLISPNGQNSFDMQRDGNLVLYWKGHPMWSSHTRGHPGAFAVLQHDGNFVIYQGRRALWSSMTNGKSGVYYLGVQNDGNVVLHAPDGRQLWTTRTEVATGLQLGSTGPAVYILQTRLAVLGYWLGRVDGVFGASTQQAVWALQKAAGLQRDGVVGRATASALTADIVPRPRPASGNLIEVNLNDDLLMVLHNGKLWATLNTSTGGGYTYTSGGVTAVAITPTGVFHIFNTINGWDIDSLGALWRPRFFYEGFAIHGDGYVPPYPVSHGCVRLSFEAIDWIWANNVAPIGMEVWIY